MSTNDLRDLLGSHATLADQLLDELRADRARLPVLFPGLPRRFGKDPIGGGRREFGDAVVDLDAFRTCDLVAAYLCASIEASADELTLGVLAEAAATEQRAGIPGVERELQRLVGEGPRRQAGRHDNARGQGLDDLHDLPLGVVQIPASSDGRLSVTRLDMGEAAGRRVSLELELTPRSRMRRTTVAIDARFVDTL